MLLYLSILNDIKCQKNINKIKYNHSLLIEFDKLYKLPQIQYYLGQYYLNKYYNDHKCNLNDVELTML